MKAKSFFFIVLVLFIHHSVFGQCIATGPNSSASSINNGSIGTVGWQNPVFGLLNDNNGATVPLLISILGGQQSNYLFQTDFGFSIPPTAVICGIEVNYVRRAQGLAVLAGIRDNSVRLINGGAVVGVNRATATTWPFGTFSNELHGGNTDLWGTAWTPAQINSPNFGVAISCRILGLLGLLITAEVDHVEITVHYDVPLPVGFKSFTVTRSAANRIDMFWETENEVNNDFFTIEKSPDSENWQPVATVQGNGNTVTPQTYYLSDFNASTEQLYYKLSQTDFDGTMNELDIAVAERFTDENTLLINQLSDHSLVLKSFVPLKISLISATGQVLWSAEMEKNQTLPLSLSPFAAGLMFLFTQDQNGQVKVYQVVK